MNNKQKLEAALALLEQPGKWWGGEEERKAPESNPPVGRHCLLTAICEYTGPYNTPIFDLLQKKLAERNYRGYAHVFNRNATHDEVLGLVREMIVEIG